MERIKRILKRKRVIFIILIVAFALILVICFNKCDISIKHQDSYTDIISNKDVEEISKNSVSAVYDIANDIAKYGIIDNKDDTSEKVEYSEIESEAQVVDNTIDTKIEELVIDIPNVDCYYEFAYLNDAHVITGEMDDISADNIENVLMRRESYLASNYSDATFISLCSQVDAIAGSGVILNGDILDYVSTSNINTLKSGLGMINNNIMYIRADHDYGVWYSDNISYSDSYNMQNSVFSDRDVVVWNYPEFKIIGINKTTSQISENAMSMIEEAYYVDDRPVIFISHVPVNSVIDGNYGENIANAWGGRNLSWGYGCYYEPNDITKRWLDMIYDENTHVVAVIAGHVHMSYDYMITNKVRGHIFDPAFLNVVGKIVIV